MASFRRIVPTLVAPIHRVCDLKVELPHVGQDGILRRVGNPPAGALYAAGKVD
jgi:hypothetical protein